MAKLISIEKMKEIEKEANNHGLTYSQMMVNAGEGVAEEIKIIAHRENVIIKSVIGLIGPGNNGGDTIIALKNLISEDTECHALLFSSETENSNLIKDFSAKGGRIHKILNLKRKDGFGLVTFNGSIIIDGVLGTGFHLPMKKELEEKLYEIKQLVLDLKEKPLIIAVDCPSGVDNNTGEVADCCIPADYTICIAAIKQGLLKMPAYEFVGKIVTREIGFNDFNSSISSIRNEVADESNIKSLMIKRPIDSHKGTFGTSLIVAGSINYTGAALLAGRAAYSVGTGLVTLAVPSVIQTGIVGHIPEATWLLLPHDMGVISETASQLVTNNLDKVTALLLGCGWGTESTTLEFLKKLLSPEKNQFTRSTKIGFIPAKEKTSKHYLLPPLIIDADGLKLLAKIRNWHDLIPSNTILTPHPGEMELLTGISKEEIQKDRLKIAEKYSREWGVVLVLKGAFSIIATPDGRTTTIPIATSALAKAGSGDVLAGMITGFVAQGYEPTSASILATWFHALAGIQASKIVGSDAAVMASDLIKSIGLVVRDYI